jgi:hypothetical protein
MDNYEYLLNSITVGRQTQYANMNLTLEQAHELLKLAAKKLNLVNLHPDRTNIEDICYQGEKYFAYVGSFPRPHVALDSPGGTTRLHSITTEAELTKIVTKCGGGDKLPDSFWGVK